MIHSNRKEWQVLATDEPLEVKVDVHVGTQVVVESALVVALVDRQRGTIGQHVGRRRLLARLLLLLLSAEN